MTSGIYLAGEHPHVTMVKGVPTSVKVRVFNRLTSALVEETTSGQDGTWRVDLENPPTTYDVVFSHDGYRDIIVSNVKPIGYVEAVVFKLTIDKDKVSGSHVDYPLYVDLSLMPSEFWGAVKDGGGDIRCYQGETELPREVVSCDVEEETGELHILLSDIGDDEDTEVLIIVDGFNDDYAVDAEFGAEAVWSNYSAVIHSSRKNSANSKYLAITGDVTQDFLHDDKKWLKFENAGYLEDATLSSSIHAVSIALKPSEAIYAGWRNAISFGDYQFKSLAFGLWSGAHASSRCFLTNRTVKTSPGEAELIPTGDIPSDTTTRVTFFWDGTKYNCYFNGTLISRSTGYRPSIEKPIANLMSFSDLIIGSKKGSYQFDGLLADIRISTTQIDSDFVTTEYSNHTSPSTFFKSIEIVSGSSEE